MIVTLLTDFGTADYYVAAMKGAILSRAPRATIVDLTHEIPPQDIHQAAFTTLAAYRTFPAKTVHTVVVDPGVGSERRPIAVVAGEQFFGGPDNGVFSYVLDREPAARVFHITNERFFQQPVSTTFHGRDIFAPVAAALAGGAKPAEIGEEVRDCVRLDSVAPERVSANSLRGRILHVDRFGNCVTNFTAADLPPEQVSRGFRLMLGRQEIRSLRRHYAEAEATGEVFAIWGSAGFLEISANRESAALRLCARPGQPIDLSLA
jgi:hypothetical protein